MPKKRRQYSAEFKFRIALEAAKGERTVNMLASAYSIHPTQINQWKRQLLDEGVGLFSRNGARQQQEQAVVQAELYEQIGRLKMELEWLKKKAALFD
jgi:transposase-like protein